MSVSGMYAKTVFSICDMGAIRSSSVRLEKESLLSVRVEGVDATMIILRLAMMLNGVHEFTQQENRADLSSAGGTQNLFTLLQVKLRREEK